MRGLVAHLWCTATPHVADYPCSLLRYRAAAHSTLQQHENAILDCKRAIELDPKYLKAYSRLGYVHAAAQRRPLLASVKDILTPAFYLAPPPNSFSLFSLGKYTEAIDLGYKRVLEIDPENTGIVPPH